MRVNRAALSRFFEQCVRTFVVIFLFDIIEHLFYNVIPRGDSVRGIYVMDLCTKTQQKIDMICQHKSDGTIIPIKFRMVDDDGLYQEYKIKGYKDLSFKGKLINLEDAGLVHSSVIVPFECRIESFGRDMVVNIYYNSDERIWVLSNPRRK